MKSPHRQSLQYFGSETRAISSQIGYVFAIAIISILMAGLIASTSGVVTQSTEQGTQAELQIIGDRISAQVMTADRILASDDASSELVLSADIPARAGDEPYTISYSDSELVLKNMQTDITVTIPLETSHNVVIESNRATDWTIYSNGGDIHIGTLEDSNK